MLGLSREEYTTQRVFKGKETINPDGTVKKEYVYIVIINNQSIGNSTSQDGAKEIIEKAIQKARFFRVQKDTHPDKIFYISSDSVSEMLKYLEKMNPLENGEKISYSNCFGKESQYKFGDKDYRFESYGHELFTMPLSGEK